MSANRAIGSKRSASNSPSIGHIRRFGFVISLMSRTRLQVARKGIRYEDQADQDLRGRPGEALRFYTDGLGFVKKADVTQEGYRWLTVASSEEPDGTELQLALNDNPAAKTYQETMFQQDQPAAMFFTDDVQADHERINARGAEFSMPPTQVTGSTIAMVNDTCGNLIQLTQLTWRG